MIKKVICCSIGMIAFGVAVLWLQFVLLPYYEAWTQNAELLSPKLWPNNVDEICCTNGKSLLFNLGNRSKGRKQQLRVINSNNIIHDISAPEGGWLLYCSRRGTLSDPLVVTWDNIFDLEDIGRDKPNPVYNISVTEIKDDFSEITKTVKSTKEIYFRDADDNWILGDITEITGKSSKSGTIVLMSTRNEHVINVPIKKRDISAIAIVGDKIIYDEALPLFPPLSPQTSRKLYFYSLSDKKEKVIGETRDVSRDGWAFNGSIIAWSDHQFHDDKYDIYYYDFDHNTKGKLLQGEGSQNYPFLSKEYIIWSEKKQNSLTGYDIFVKNLRTGTIKGLVIASGDQIHPVYFNGYLYWTNHIYSYLSKIDLFGNSQAYVFRKKVILP